MERPISGQLEVRISPLQAGFATVILFMFTVALVRAYDITTGTGKIFLLILSMFALLTATYAKMWLGRRLLFVINDQGITDCGFFSQGFGLIRWQNIEAVTPRWMGRGGLSLFIKVNNYGELVSQRNLLMLPFLFLGGVLNGFFGAQISLPIGWGDTDVEIVRQQIAHCSNNKIQVPSPVGPLQSFLSSVAASIVVLFIIAAIFGVLAATYQLWQHTRPPTLKILAQEARRGETKIQMGKQVWLEDYTVQNFGKETTGLQVEISGQAFDSNLLKNPQVLIDYLDKSRELIPLVQVKKNSWVGVSKRAFLAHKDDALSGSFQQLLSGKCTQAAGWWTNLLYPCLTIELFADVPNKGKGNISLKVVPMTYPGGTASMLTRVVTTAEKFGGAPIPSAAAVADWSYSVPILSVAVPSDFPVTTYPDAQILWLSRSDVRLDSAATPGAIAAYYKEELNRKRWNTTVREYQANKLLIVAGSKGGDFINIKIWEIEHHTSIEILFWAK